MKRFLSLMLALCLICALFAGCGKSDAADNSTGKMPPVFDNDKDQNSQSPDPNPDPKPDPKPVDPNPSGSSEQKTTPSDITADPNPSGNSDQKTTPSDIPTGDTPGGSTDTPVEDAPSGNTDTPGAADHGESGTTPDPIDPPSGTENKPYERGTCDYYGWVSEWADLRFTAPGNYEVNVDFLNLPDPEGGYKEMQTFDITGTGSFTQVYVYLAQTPDQTEDEFIAQYISQLRDDVTPSDISSIDIGGKTFRYISTKSTFPGASCGAYAAAKQGDYFIEISVKAVSEKAVNIIFNAFSQNP